MSVRRRPDRGNRPEVRWKEGGRHRSRLFDKVRDAEAFDREIKRNKQLGTLASSVLQSHMTLTDFVRDEWWPKYAIPNLDQSTREVYAQTWAKDLLPRVGGYELRELTPAVVEDLRAQLHAANVGEPTQIKALGILQGICKRAVVRGLIPSNPVLPVDKPRQTTRPQLDPLAPVVVENDSRPTQAVRRDSRFDPRLRRPASGGGPASELAGRARTDDAGVCRQDQASSRRRFARAACSGSRRVAVAVWPAGIGRADRADAGRRRVEEA